MFIRYWTLIIFLNVITVFWKYRTSSFLVPQAKVLKSEVSYLQLTSGGSVHSGKEQPLSHSSRFRREAHPHHKPTAPSYRGPASKSSSFCEDFQQPSWSTAGAGLEKAALDPWSLINNLHQACHPGKQAGQRGWEWRQTGARPREGLTGWRLAQGGSSGASLIGGTPLMLGRGPQIWFIGVISNSPHSHQRGRSDLTQRKILSSTQYLHFKVCFGRIFMELLRQQFSVTVVHHQNFYV